MIKNFGIPDKMKIKKTGRIDKTCLCILCKSSVLSVVKFKTNQFTAAENKLQNRNFISSNREISLKIT